MPDLDPDENEILAAYQAGRLEPVVPSSAVIEGYRAAARTVSRKDDAEISRPGR